MNKVKLENQILHECVAPFTPSNPLYEQFDHAQFIPQSWDSADDVTGLSWSWIKASWVPWS